MEHRNYLISGLLVAIDLKRDSCRLEWSQTNLNKPGWNRKKITPSSRFAGNFFILIVCLRQDRSVGQSLSINHYKFSSRDSYRVVRNHPSGTTTEKGK